MTTGYIPVAVTAFVLVIFTAFAIDLYIAIYRPRLKRQFGPPAGKADVNQPLEKISGVDTTGELTTGAKYAIWNYMFSILGVGGAIIGIIAGLVGYMINDLARKGATQTALEEMQKPLLARLADLANTQGALKVAAANVTTDKFRSDVASEVASGLSKNMELMKGVADLLAPNSELRKAISDDLATRYVEQLRGNKGKDGVDGISPAPVAIAAALSQSGSFQENVTDLLVRNHGTEFRGADSRPGKDGNDGANGLSVTPDEVAGALTENELFRTQVASLLVKDHSAELRGASGAPGLPGRDGKDGGTGQSVTPDTVAVVLTQNGEFREQVGSLLVRDHARELRGLSGTNGAPGKDGKDGANGQSATADVVADALDKDDGFRAKVVNLLLKDHSAELRGAPGADGQPGKEGKAGTNGESPSPSTIADMIDQSSTFRAAVADELFSLHDKELRGPPGNDGKNDRVATSPEPVAEILKHDTVFIREVADAVAERRGDELRKPLVVSGSSGQGGVSPNLSPPLPQPKPSARHRTHRHHHRSSRTHSRRVKAG